MQHQQVEYEEFTYENEGKVHKVKNHRVTPMKQTSLSEYFPK
jgi:hypothetical protein